MKNLILILLVILLLSSCGVQLEYLVVKSVEGNKVECKDRFGHKKVISNPDNLEFEINDTLITKHPYWSIP